MRQVIVTMSFFACINVFAQEFETHKNGLIYSEVTMNKLEKIVDSLNLKFKNCDLNKTFYSKEQTIGHIVKLDSGNIKQAKIDIDNHMSFDDFTSKYPHAAISKNVLIVNYKYKDDNNNDAIEYDEVNLNSNYGLEIQSQGNKSISKKDLKNTWIYQYSEATDYYKESIDAFYFPENFKSTQIKDKYAQKIGYSDCLIDTSTTKFLENTKDGWVSLPENWQSLSLKKKEKLLEEMRSIHVVGGCSMDSRPREHAMNIALLSAETTKWEVFLKSHLDIMNDRFDRMSDGSYAKAQRKTYIKELEELDINVNDLLIGISLRIENPASNHYYGNIGRLGRAISESKNKLDFESQILSMIEDNELDDYNRIISYFLFISYNNYLDNKEEHKRNIEKVKSSITKLPVYLKENIKIEED